MSSIEVDNSSVTIIAAAPLSELCYMQKESEITSEEYLLERIALFEGKMEALRQLKPALYEAIA
jgi:hypothetical protein